MSSINDDITHIFNDYKESLCFNELNNKEKFNTYVDIIQHTYLQFSDNTENITNVIKNILLKYRDELSYVCIDDEKLTDITNQIKNLKTIKQPVQRSKEWYEYRNNRLTASDLGTALNINPYSKRNKLIAKKCGYDEPFFEGPAIRHGVKYEDVAIHIYEKRNNVSVFEYGCIPHPTIPHFGASPDGICDIDSKNKNFIGRMLEIKCPKSRIINEFVPEHYELQVQGQLEVCGLDFCDFLECSIKEYDSMEIYLQDYCGNNLNKTKNGCEKGIIFEFFDPVKEKNVYFYEYDLFIKEEILSFQNKIVKENNNIIYCKTTFWYLETYSVKLIKRDRERFENEFKPEIDRFWNDVLHYRKKGYSSLIYKKKKSLLFSQIHHKYYYIYIYTYSFNYNKKLFYSILFYFFLY